MTEIEKNGLEVFAAMGDKIPEAQRQRILGIAEGIAIANSLPTPKKEEGANE